MIIPWPKIINDIGEAKNEESNGYGNRFQFEIVQDSSKAYKTDQINEYLGFNQCHKCGPENLKEQCRDEPITKSHWQSKIFKGCLTQVKPVGAFPGKKDINTVGKTNEKWKN